MAKLLGGTRIYGNATVDTFLSVGSNIAASNLSVNTVTANNWIGIYTANVIESNSNLYYTNARVRSTLSATDNSIVYDKTNGTIQANVAYITSSISSTVTGLTTSNIAEGSNLYYTNTRVVSAVTGTLLSNLSVNGNVQANTLVANNFILRGIDLTQSLITGNVVSGTSTSDILVANAVYTKAITSNTWTGLYTANVIETAGNLYFTNTRAVDAITNATLSNITIASNIAIGSGAGGTISGANLISAAYIQANTWLGLYTTNVIEGTNLYYTNARVRSTLSGGTGVVYDTTSGQISIGQNVATTANVTFAALNVTGTTNFYGNVITHSSNNLSISDNMIYLNSGSESSNPDLGFAGNYNDGTYHHAGFFRDALDKGTWKVFENYQPEPDANIYINTSHASFRLANLAATTFYGNVQGQVSTISNFTTDNLAEGTNLYYTNTRVVTVVVPYLTTANVIESSSNLYYTNARVISAVTPYLTTANVNEFDGNLYYTNARVYSNVAPLLALKANVVDLTTSNVIELNNLYFTNARAIAAIVNTSLSNLTVTGNITAGNILTGSGSGGTISGGNLISATYVQANNWLGLYTANVIESAGNLYYSNDRVYANVSPLLALKANIVDLTTSNVVELNNLYYTNTRVYSNVAPLLALKANVKDLTTSNVVELNNLYYTNTRVYSNVSPLLALKANVVDLTTSNVVELNNLYYTNTRVYSNVSPLLALKANVVDLTTANVFESSSNLYFTNARVVSAVTNAQLSNLSVTGNVVAGNIITGGTSGFITGANLIVTNYLQANIWTGLYSSNIIEFGNLFYTNTRVYSNVIALLPTLAGTGIAISANGIISATTNVSASLANLTTANVTEVGSNLYFTNARVYSNIVSALTSFTTSNINEGSNLYYTNARVYSNIVSALYSFTTSNINEGSNLYYTNARVASYLSTSNIDVSFGNVTVVGNLYVTGDINEINSTILNVDDKNIIVAKGTPSALLADGAGLLIDGAQANLIYSYTGDKFVVTKGLDVLNGILNSTNLVSTFATVNGNAIVTGNLVTSNIRTNSLIVNGVELVTGTGNITVSTISANVWQGLYTANVIETSGNLYFTNARVYANIAPLLTTANITESSSNLYFTNTRTISAVVNTTLANISVSGNVNTSNLNTNVLYANTFISTGVGIPTIDSITNINLNANGTIGGAVVIGSSPLRFRSYTTVDSGNLTPSTGDTIYNSTIAGLQVWNGSAWISAANVTAYVTSLTANLTTANVAEVASNLYYTNARVLSFVSANITTSNIAEGSNLYYTNNRVYSNVIALLNTYTTSNINEGSNLYYTNTRVYSNIVSAIASFTTANINEGSNLYYTNTRVYSNVITLVSSLTTANINEGSNLYFTNSRVVSAVVNSTLSNINVSGNIFANNITIANTITLQNINVTSNILNGGGSVNTAFLNSSNVITGNIQANAWYGLTNLAGNGLVVSTNTTSGIQTLTVDAANLTILAQGSPAVVAYDTFTGGNKNYTLTRTIAGNNANVIMVSINGLEQIPGIDYSLTGSQSLSFAANTTLNSTIAVKYLGYSAYVTPNALVLATSTVIPTVQGQSSYLMGANVSAPEKILVILDGLTQRPTTDYTVNNTTLTFTSAPPEGSNIEIRFMGQEALALNGAANTTSYISNSITLNGGGTRFNLGSNVSFARNIIVNVDGLAQIPVTDYNISGGNTLIFTSNVSANSVVEVKFFGAEALGTINFNNTIVAASLTGGNGVKITSNGIITVDVLSPFLLMGA